MRHAASVLSATTAAVVLILARSAAAREAPAVDDASGVGTREPSDAERAEEADALEEAALGPRSNMRTRAEEVSFDAQEKTLELKGNVRVDAPPFHLTSEHIKLARTRYGIEIDGHGSLAFCPCLGTPLRVDFDRAIVAPPGDLILENPTLRFYSVPVLPLPYFWLRSNDKPGVLPPDLAYRGQDGVFVGGGVHVPWRSHGERNTLDLRGGAYETRGFVAEARMRTAGSTTKIRYDRLPGGAGVVGTGPNADDGLLVDARGATSSGELGVSWDADVLRGGRGVASTTELDAAARRWDRASVEGVLRSGPLVVATAMRAVTSRGGNLTDVDAAGPVTTVRASGAAGSAITYDATIEGGALRTSDGTVSRDTLSFARAEVGARAAVALSAFEASLSVRGAGDVAAESRQSGSDRAGSARARIGLPLMRRFGVAPAAIATSDGPVGGASGPPASGASGPPVAGGASGPPALGGDPWVHVLDPFAEAAVVDARGDDVLGMPPSRGGSGVDGSATIVDGGLTSTIGRWSSREAFEIGGVAGAAIGDRSVPSRVRPLVRGRAAATLAWFGASAEVASVLGGATTAANGFAAVGRVRLGKSDGVRLLTNVAARDGVDPVLARALVDAPLEPASGFLTSEGTTGGAGIVVPWSHAVTTSFGADGDATHEELVAARAGVEVRDRCGCLVLHVMGSHRIGREGVDVWLALDFAADR